MYHKIKTRLFFILLFGSFTSYGQLGYMSLVNICAEQFNNDKYIYPYRECKGCKVDARKEIDDTFGRYILLGAYNLDSVDFDIESTNLRSPYVFRFTTEYLVYMIDIYTGKIVSVKNFEKFNTIMNTTKNKLNNIDKCYLYLLLNHTGVFGFSDWQNGYPRDIKQSQKFSLIQSVFGNRKRYGDIENPEWLCAKIKNDKDSSNNSNIVIYEFLSDTSKYLACRYQFLFDSTDNISAINKEYIK